MKKFSLWLLSLAISASMLPMTMASAEQGWVNLEAEDGSYSEEFSEYSNAAASGGGGLVVGQRFNNSEGNVDHTLTPSIDWTFNIPETGRYDAWALVMKPNLNWQSRYKFAFNDETLDYYMNHSTSVFPYIEGNTPRFPVYIQSCGEKSGFYEGELCWIKISEGKTFSEGVNTLHYETEERPTKDGLYLNTIDSVRIVPTEWNWMASCDLTEPYINIPVFRQNDDGLVWMEAEDAYAPDFTVASGSQGDVKPSSGKYIMMGSKKESGQTFDAQFKFDIKTPDTYDVWVLAQRPNENHLSRYQFALDSEEANYVDDTWNGFRIKSMPSIYKSTVVGSAIENYWIKARAGVNLDGGIHNFTFRIGERPMKDGYYITSLDCVAVVPSSWNWIPEANTEKPKPAAGLYNWIELENPKNDTNLKRSMLQTNIEFAKEASNRGLLFAEGISNGDSESLQNEKLAYDFTVAKDGIYDIYYLGTNCATEYLSRLYWDIDNADIFVDTNNHEHQLLANGSNISTAMYTVANHPLMWQKMASNKALTAGDHILNLEYICRQVAPTHFLRADAVLIVPSEWEWTMPAEAENPGVTAAELDALEKYYYLNGLFEEGISGDINLDILNLRGSAGSTFAYKFLTPDIISSDGTVTRPGFGEGSTQALINCTANKELTGSGYSFTSAETDIYLMVLESELVDYKNFAAKYSDGTTISGALKSGAVVNASADVKLTAQAEDTSAMLVTAVYKDGALIEASGDSTALTADYQTLEASVTLPEDTDMSGYSVKVFLWDNFETANPYAEPLKY